MSQPFSTRGSSGGVATSSTNPFEDGTYITHCETLKEEYGSRDPQTLPSHLERAPTRLLPYFPVLIACEFAPGEGPPMWCLDQLPRWFAPQRPARTKPVRVSPEYHHVWPYRWKLHRERRIHLLIHCPHRMAQLLRRALVLRVLRGKWGRSLRLRSGLNHMNRIPWMVGSP